MQFHRFIRTAFGLDLYDLMLRILYYDLLFEIHAIKNLSGLSPTFSQRPGNQ